MELTGLALRTLVVYFFVLFCMRLMDKRTGGRLSLFDLMLAIMMADLAVLPLVRIDVPLLTGLVPVAVLFITRLVTAFFSSLSRTVRPLVEAKSRPVAKSVILVEDGRVNHDNLAKLGKNVFWLKKEIKERTGNSLFRNVSLCLWDDEGRLYVALYDE